MSAEAVRVAFAEQAMWCSRFGSPFTSLICSLVAERMDASTEIGRLALGWRGDPSPGADNLPARLCGGLHFLVLRGEAPGLARLYPPATAPDPEQLWAEILPVLGQHAPALARWLDNPPQTNEVARSAGLMSGLLVVASRFGTPIRLLELGASAGLNLMLDRYDHALGSVRAGRSGSPVRLSPMWTGSSPPNARVQIVDRRGVDLRPVDLGTEREKLLAFVWADQIERRKRLEAAIALVATDPPQIDSGDAADWLDRMLPSQHRNGAACVVMHSVAFQYFPEHTKQRIAARIAAAGEAATPDMPLAWLRYEHESGEERPSLRLRLWPEGEDRQLAWCHSHGASVEWVADERRS